VCIQDSCWSVGTIYDPTELPRVSTAGPGIERGVTSGIRADPRGFTGVCGLGGSGIVGDLLSNAMNQEQDNIKC
jgi:hypothetical protein